MSKESRKPCDMTVGEASDRIRNGSLSSVALVESVFERMRSTEPMIHAYVCTLEEGAIERARQLDREASNGQFRGRLHGIPIAIKDIYDVAGSPTLCGSRAREGAQAATHDAPAVAALRDAGAILTGKTVTQEFAAGVVSNPARNPWDPSRIPGGSSGGSAAATSAGSALAAMGSDTGGSIRIPASLCGLVGFKPTFGTINTHGVFPLSWSLDTAGPITRTVADAQHLLRALGVFDSDSRSTPTLRDRPRIGVSRSHFFDTLQGDVRSAIDSNLGKIEDAGVDLVEVDWQQAKVARACSFIINRVETAAVHVKELRSSGHLYGVELRRRIEASALFPATGYIKALRARGVIRDSIASLFKRHQLDGLFAPTLPGTAAPADHTYVQYSDGSEEHVALAYTRLTMPFNVTGQPVISLPTGFDAQNLPIGIQIAGEPYGDARLCELAKIVESTISFGHRVPPVAMRRSRLESKDADNG